MHTLVFSFILASFGADAMASGATDCDIPNRDAKAFCVADFQDKSLCATAFAEPLESWCEAYAEGLRHCNSLSDEGQKEICQLLGAPQRRASSCRSARYAKDEDKKFCEAILMQRDAYCTYAGDERTRCNYVVAGLEKATQIKNAQPSADDQGQGGGAAADDDLPQTRGRSNAVTRNTVPIPARPAQTPDQTIASIKQMTPAQSRTAEWAEAAAEAFLASPSKHTFDQLWASQSWRAQLKAFMDAEYNDEHYRFLEAVDAGQLTDQQLFDTYIRPGSEYEVNIPASQRTAIYGALRANSAPDWGPSVNEVTELIKSDPFSRYLKSDAYKDRIIALLR